MKIGYCGRLPKPENSNLEKQLLELEKYNCNSYEQEKENYTSIETTLLFDTISNLNKGDKILVCAFKYLARNKTDLKKALSHSETMGVSIVLTGVEMTPSNILQAYDDFNSYIHSYKIRNNNNNPKEKKWKKGVRRMARSRLEERKPFSKSIDDEALRIITLITEEAAIRKRGAGRPLEITSKMFSQIKLELANGLSVKEVAKQREVSTRTIYRAIKKHNIKLGDKK